MTSIMKQLGHKSNVVFQIKIMINSSVVSYWTVVWL